MDGWNGVKNVNEMDLLGIGNPSKRPKNSKLIEKDPRRHFSKLQCDEVYSRQSGHCANPKCKKWLDPKHTEYDHIKPWALGGKTTIKNCQALCANCHSEKTKRERLKGIESKQKEPKPQKPNFNDSLMNPFGTSQKKKKSNNDSWLYP